MNDQDQPGSEPGFDDPAHDDVRALLAGARATDPVPDDVVARLDATLAALTADRRGTAPDVDGPTVVVPLRRRSRTGSRLLAAAAAVIVVGAGGVGLAEVLRSTGSGTGVADSVTAAAPESDDASAPPELAPASPEAPRDSLSIPEVDLGRLAAQAGRSLPQFTSTGFAAEAAAFRSTYLVELTGGLQSGFTGTNGSEDAGGATGADGDGSAPKPGTTTGESSKDLGRLDTRYSTYAKAACPGPRGTNALVVPVRYDGKPAALAVHRPTSTGRLYAAWSCDGTTLLAWTVVPR